MFDRALTLTMKIAILVSGSTFHNNGISNREILTANLNHRGFL